MIKASKTAALFIIFLIFCVLLLTTGQSEKRIGRSYPVVPDSTILEGNWTNKGTHYEASEGCFIIITYNSRIPSIVMSAKKRGAKAEVVMYKQPVQPQYRGKDIKTGGGRTFMLIGAKIGYLPVSDWRTKGSKTLFIYCDPGINFYKVFSGNKQ